MIQLSPDHLQTTQGILAQHLPGRRVCAFGSRVQGTARPTSDLDVLVLGSTALLPCQRAELKLAFSESNLPFFVDLVEQARITPAFFEKISSQTELLAL